MPAIVRLAGRTTLYLLVSSLVCFISLRVLLVFLCPAPCAARSFLSVPLPSGAGEGSDELPTTASHLVFALASSARSLPGRRRYIRSWWDPSRLRGFVFLDCPISEANANASELRGLPQILISEDASRFPYSFPGGGRRSAVRVARVAKELVEAAEGMAGVRWAVLGDDDTVFFPENLAVSLRKHDWRRWHYVGSHSEAVEQNEKFSFDMAFGGGGFALSWPLAKALARVLDSCLLRYAHLYGSDERIFSCLAELGVGLTNDPGFHQVDLRGDIFGLLAAHPLSPLISLHHLDAVAPIFPGMDRAEALDQFFTAARADPGRILQQTVCYDRLANQTVSISWGYAVQIFARIHLLPELLSRQKTFTPWTRGRAAAAAAASSSSGNYMFRVRELPLDPCARPAVFFFVGVAASAGGTRSFYVRRDAGICAGKGTPTRLKRVEVSSQFLSKAGSQREGGRRHCCDVLPSSSEEVMEVKIRECGDELIAMQP